MVETRDLSVLSDVERALVAAKSLPDIKALRDKAEAARAYAKAANMGLELQNQAAEFKLRAERKAGMQLAKMRLRGGDRKSTRSTQRLSLDDLGISPSQSKRWQLVATLSKREFEQYVAHKRSAKEEITLADALRLARAKKGAPGKAKNGPSTSNVRNNGWLAEPLELVIELRNHCALLRQILDPESGNASNHLAPTEQRIADRLLKESAQLLHKLERSLTRSSTNCDTTKL